MKKQLRILSGIFAFLVFLLLAAFAERGKLIFGLPEFCYFSPITAFLLWLALVMTIVSALSEIMGFDNGTIFCNSTSVAIYLLFAYLILSSGLRFSLSSWNGLFIALLAVTTFAKVIAEIIGLYDWFCSLVVVKKNHQKTMS